MQRSDPTAWDESNLADPHQIADKQRRVRDMFAAIAPKYDLNNRLHSFGLDQRWRKKTVQLAELKPTDRVLDIACGTGDLTLAFSAALKKIGGTQPLIGLDYTYEMLPLARQKSALGEAIYLNGDAQQLPLPDASVDVVSIAFGIRNVQEPMRALREFRRVLRPGGRAMILEFSQPTNPVIRWCSNLYCNGIMPHTATWISRDKAGAYKYLPMSVKTFVTRPQMIEMMQQAGFSQVTSHAFSFGVSVCYRGVVG